MREVEIAIIGAGHAGLNALKQVKAKTDSWILINGGELGTTCARVGCMPSKAIIELAGKYCSSPNQQLTDKTLLPELLEDVRDYRDIFVDLVLANTTDNMKENTELLKGYAKFIEPNLLSVNDELIRAEKIIVATGSQPIIPREWQLLGDRLLTSDSLFEVEALPESVAVIGLGFIGLEMGQALHRLGVKVVGFNHDDHIAGISDRVINQEAINIFNKEFPVHVGKAAQLIAEDDGVRINSGDISVKVDKVFVAIGRRPNIPEGLTEFCETDYRGIPLYDKRTLKVGNLPVYLTGDAMGDRMMLQDAAREGKHAGANAISTQDKQLSQQVPMSIAFTNPNICHVGAKLDEISSPIIGEQRFGPIGRALIMRNNRGLIRLYASATDGRLLGASMIGPRVEHLAHLVAWSIQQSMTVDDMLEMPFYHPVIEEALQDALKDTAKKLAKNINYLPKQNVSAEMMGNA